MADCVYTLTHTHMWRILITYIYRKIVRQLQIKCFEVCKKIPSHSETTLNLQMQFYLFSLAISQVWFDFSHCSEIIKHEMFIRMAINQIPKGETHLQNVKRDLRTLLGTFNSTHTMFSPCCAHLLRIYQQAERG